MWSDVLNWADDSEPTIQVVATFPLGFPNGDTTITLANEVAKSLAFNDSYTLSDGSIMLPDAAVISVDTGKSAAITSALILNGALAKAGAGNVSVNHIRATGLLVADGALIIAPNGGNAGTSVVDDLTTIGSGRFDLNDNDLIVHATAMTKDAVHDSIENDITSAQNGVDINFVTNWDGPGITSSSARTANVAAGFDLTALGVIRNSDLDITTGVPGSAYATFSGQSVTPDDVLVKYTYTGDGNLDGAVTFDDYAAMDAAFFGTIPNLGWATGDINFDNVINFDDYAVVDQAFFNQAAPLAHTEVARVPEPSTYLVALIIALAGGWLCRRRQ
jgi:hypothetical protein